MKRTQGNWNKDERGLFFNAASIRYVEDELMKLTQGNWDPNLRSMFFNAAMKNLTEDLGKGDSRTYEYGLREGMNNLFAINDFAQPGNSIRREGKEWQAFLASIESGCPTFLDSGVFWLTNQHKKTHGTTMDEALALAPEEIDNFDWLFDVYVEVVKEVGDQLWGYNELDQGGKENKIRTRARLEGMGLRPIPVYHPLNDGWDYFDELAKEYDRICFGNLVQAPPPVRKRLLATAFERHAEYPDLFIHFLGITPNEIQMALPFDSCDSSAWIAIRKFAHSVRFQASGQKRWIIPREWLPPLPWTWVERGPTNALMLSESYARQRAMRHWNQTVIDNITGTRYPTGVADK